MKNKDQKGKPEPQKNTDGKETSNTAPVESNKPPVADENPDLSKTNPAETDSKGPDTDLPSTDETSLGTSEENAPSTKRKLTAEDMINNPEFAGAGLKEGDEVDMGPEAIAEAKKAMAAALAKTKTSLGNDADGTEKLSINETLNIVSKSIVHIFEDRKKTSLPKITPTEVEKLLVGYDGVKINWQFADLNKTKGRLALVSTTNSQDHVLLPIDVNEEWEFGVDYELMAKEARERGEEFGEKELAAAKAKAELDENDKNRESIEHLDAVSKTICDIFAERETTCLPKLTDRDVRHVLRNQAKTIGIETVYTNEDETEGYYELTEFLNKVRAPKEGNFNFGVDNVRIAEKMEAKNKAELAAAAGK